MQNKKPSKFYLQLKQSKQLIKPAKVEDEEVEGLKAMKLELAAKFMCKRLKEINVKMILGLISAIW